MGSRQLGSEIQKVQRKQLSAAFGLWSCYYSLFICRTFESEILLVKMKRNNNIILPPFQVWDNTHFYFCWAVRGDGRELDVRMGGGVVWMEGGSWGEMCVCLLAQISYSVCTVTSV